MEDKECQVEAPVNVNNMLAPKAEFYDAVVDSPDTIDMGCVDMVLNMGVRRNTIFAILRDNGILQQTNIPYKRYVDTGYFRCIETKYTKPDGTNCVNIKSCRVPEGR